MPKAAPHDGVAFDSGASGVHWPNPEHRQSVGDSDRLNAAPH